MIAIRCRLLVICLVGCVMSALSVMARSPADESPKPADEAPAEQSPAEVLAALVKGGDVDAARTALADAAVAEPDNATIAALRQSLATRLMAAGKIEDAIVEVEAARVFHVARATDAGSRGSIVSSTMMLRSLYARANQTDKVVPLLDESIELLRPHVDAGTPGSGLGAIASLISSKAMLMATSDIEGATALLTKECDDLQSRIEQAENEQPLLAWIAVMQARVSLVGRTDSESASTLTSELDAAIASALEKAPDSVELTSTFLRVRLSSISRIMREDPDTAQQMLDQTTAALDQSPLKENPLIARSAAQLQSLTRSIAAAKLVKEMIGKPAPAFDIEAWAHGDALPPESLQGKVVMLDFWAVWCGPCVATFPHLKEWHEEFHDQGFEIIGVTRKYGYEWNEETGKAVRAPKETVVPLETELVALDKFMESHELHHSTIVTPAETEMNTQFGVTGIPHAVLIDRQGNVRMVKVGSGEANASALRQMIETLLAE